METINLQIVKLLKADELLNCKVWLVDDQIIIEVNNEDFEKYMGLFVRRIQKIIDVNLPQRNYDLTIVIRNKDKLLDNKIKIWKPVKETAIVNE